MNFAPDAAAYDDSGVSPTAGTAQGSSRRTRRGARAVFAASLAIALIGAGLGAACSREAFAGPPPEIAAKGTPAPKWEVTTLDGKMLSGETLHGKVVVLDFWATWCGPCRGQIPHNIALQKKYEDKGVVFLGLSLDDSADTVRKFLKSNPQNYPVAMDDGKLTSAFGGVEAIPTLFVIDRNGDLRFHNVGSMDEASLDAILQKLL